MTRISHAAAGRIGASAFGWAGVVDFKTVQATPGDQSMARE